MEQAKMETAEHAAEPETTGNLRAPSTPWEVFVATACTGKVAYSTAREAYAQTAREAKRQRRRRRNGKKLDRKREPYHCKVCGMWHMGYAKRGGRDGR